MILADKIVSLRKKAGWSQEDLAEKLGVTRIEAQGQPFDPQKHDAVMHVEDENVGENTVVEVLQQGYQLGDKVLRFAMVKVAN